jgi:hypothetical protein
MSDEPPEELPDHAIVVRGGIMNAENFMNGVSEIPGRPDAQGLSVQAAVGKTIEELAIAGNIKNARIGVATVGRIRRAGYELVKTGGAGCHWDLLVPRNFSESAAAELAREFRQELNPWTDRRRPR